MHPQIYSPPAEDDLGIKMLHDIHGYSIGGKKDWESDPMGGVKYACITFSIEVVVTPEDNETSLYWEFDGRVTDVGKYRALMENLVDAFTLACKERFGKI